MLAVYPLLASCVTVFFLTPVRGVLRGLDRGAGKWSTTKNSPITFKGVENVIGAIVDHTVCVHVFVLVLVLVW